uniref:ubiquitin carboxyl-terminal hydrolase 17-like protein D n=1 Tax=Myxine glutinosa TaxID=7769 RepID=UPI00358EB3CF
MLFVSQPKTVILVFHRHDDSSMYFHVTNVTSALKRHFSQRIEADVDCESCYAKYDYHAHSIHDPPNVLTLVLKRFNKSVNGKIDKNVKFSKELDLRPYLTHPCKDKLIYKLYAAIVHTGEDCTSGSYLSYVKGSNRAWYMKKNEDVKEVKITTVLKQKAYMLFYVRYAVLVETFTLPKDRIF